MSVWDGEARRAATPDATDDASAQIDTVVVGGGQAGLAVGYHLARRAHDFVILEAGDEPGVAWRNRWDSLRLFTPAGFSHLPGMRFPGPGAALPSKDEMADYLSAYAVRFGLPVEFGVRVDAVRRADDEFLISAAGRRWRARNVVAATGPYAVARVPEFAPALDPTVTQLTAQSYRRPEQLPDGPALVVGAGNSGAEIALDLAPTRPVWLSGPDVLQVPRLGVAAYRLMRLLGPLWRAAGRGPPGWGGFTPGRGESPRPHRGGDPSRAPDSRGPRRAAPAPRPAHARRGRCRVVRRISAGLSMARPAAGRFDRAPAAARRDRRERARPVLRGPAVPVDHHLAPRRRRRARRPTRGRPPDAAPRRGTPPTRAGSEHSVAVAGDRCDSHSTEMERTGSRVRIRTGRGSSR